MAAALRGHDWAATPLGPMERWPASLKTLLATLMASRQPMLLWWGPEHLQFYNDAFDQCFAGDRLPGGIGRRGMDCWGELWPNMARGIAQVLEQGRATWYTDKLVPVWRDGRMEDVYWTYGYSPAFDDAQAVGGVLVTATDTTSRVLGERRQQLLARMAAAMAGAHSLPEIARNALAVANDAPGDIERALICRLEDTQGWVPHFAHDPADLAPVRDELTRRLVPDARALRQTADAMPGTDGRAVYARVLGPQAPGDRLCIAPVGRPPGIWDKAMVFELNPHRPFDPAFGEFLNQYLDLLMAALLRVDAAQVREAASLERDSVLLQAPVPAALMLGPEHRYRLANAPYCAMVGRDESELVGRTWREVFPELLDTQLPAILERAYRSGERYTSGPTRVLLRLRGAAELTECWLRVNLQPLRHSNGEVYGLMSVATDVTAQVAAQQATDRIHAERKALVDELEAAHRVKDEFLAMLGHELRNPLSPIVTALELMKMRGDGTTAREQAVIRRQVDHLLRLVDDLLDVARITRGKIELKNTRVEIADVIARAVEMASDLFEQRQQHLEIDRGPAGLACDGDATRLAQALSNLLTNASRYTPPGGHVALAARAEGQEIVLTVQDDGIGIAADLLPRVFEMFVQGARTLDRAEGGLGIGLALVKNLVELHGGQVSARSDGPGRGSTFTLRLPLALQPRAAEPGSAAGAAAPPPQARRVMVVDDNVDAADSLAEALRLMGHEVNVFHGPLDALAQGGDLHALDAAILDIGLPGMSGYELAQRLRQAHPAAECLFVALTGYGQAEDRARSHEAGFHAHMVKPVDLEALDRLLAGGTL